MKVDQLHFVGQYKGEKKKQVRAAILKSIENRKKQVAFFEQHFIKPQKDVLKMGDKVLRNELPIEFYIKQNESLSQYINKLLGGYKE
jgi:hypothetical protein